MKRYLLFLGEAYYPQGGWFDCQEDFDTDEEVRSYIDDLGFKPRWAHVIDTKIGAMSSRVTFSKKRKSSKR